jgi:polyglycine hydrolase-like protein
MLAPEVSMRFLERLTLLTCSSFPILFLSVSIPAYGADTLEDFARKCDQAIGVTVPDFVCDNGTVVPTTHFANGQCDRPNVLNGVCDPGSRFQVLANTANAYVVAHCRKQGNPAGQYGDVAVIQHNKVNGATCFYQGALNLSHDGNVKAPSKGVGSPAFWMTPTAIANSSFPCVGCHDDGPIIRSPYLTQIPTSSANALPGAGNTMFNHDGPYYFVGSDFAHWKAYKVEVAGNTCNACHRMGVNNVQVNGQNAGTARDLGIRATAQTQASKNPHSPDSPIWMLPGQITFSQSSADAAREIKNCADLFREGAALPNSSSCKITQFTGASGGTVPGTFTSVWQPGNQPEIQVYGWKYTDYRAKYDEIWPLGWRLYSLEPYVVNGQVLYNAVWRQSTEGEIQVYGWTYADYRQKYDQLWLQGWRLKILQPYVVNGQVFYTAVWRPSIEAEIQVYGWTYADYRAKYDALWPQGWRLKLLQPYVVNNQVLYTAVWRQSTEGEIQVYGWTYADYRAKYDALWPQGWRLKLLQPYVVNGQVFYTAVWRPSTEGEIQVYGWNYADYRSKYDELWARGWRLKILQAY